MLTVVFSAPLPILTAESRELTADSCKLKERRYFMLDIFYQ
jgi:hypothetical protein